MDLDKRRTTVTTDAATLPFPVDGKTRGSPDVGKTRSVQARQTLVEHLHRPEPPNVNAKKP
jgi:hypothetical protein